MKVKQFKLIFLFILSIYNFYGQEVVVFQGILPDSFIYYSNIMPNKEEACKILIEQNSNSIPSFETTLNIVNDYMIIFPEIKFDTVLVMSHQLIPKSVAIESILFLDLYTGERRLFFTPSYKGIVNEEEIIDMEDLMKIENYVWAVISQFKFYIESKPEELCIPNEPIMIRFDILLQ